MEGQEYVMERLQTPDFVQRQESRHPEAGLERLVGRLGCLDLLD